MKNQFSELLADIKEQAQYLKELGVEGLNADLPDIDSAALQTRLPHAAPKTEPPRYVPDVLPLPSLAKPAVRIEPEEVKAQRRDLIESTKLSRMAALPKREPTDLSRNLRVQNLEKEMSKPEPVAEPVPTAPLFGDVTKSLPETGETLEGIHLDVGNCTRCPLHEGRTHIVHSVGDRQAQLMFVGEAPGADEDAQGEPFVGRAGQLLNRIIEAIGLKRENVFIGNINRCRPPGNRAPTLPEAETCKSFLLREIAVVRPKVIVVLGNTACQNLLNTKVGITKLRGNFQDYYGVKVMPTFHPAYLLRDPSKKREVWDDMKKVRALLGIGPE